METTPRPLLVRVHPSDDVAVAVTALAAGVEACVDGGCVVVRDEVGAGHKVALRDLAPGEAVRKYGFPIGVAAEPIARGAWVHAHNLRTGLSGTLEYRWNGEGTGDRGRRANPRARLETPSPGCCPLSPVPCPLSFPSPPGTGTGGRRGGWGRATRCGSSTPSGA